MMDTLKMDIDALLGERWFPKETSFEEDITEYWGEWGVCSEVETLRAVLMRRPGKEVESFVAEALAKIGVPILKTIAGDGMFEGANAMWVDRHTCVVSTGSRCNRSGYEQVKTELERMGVTVYHMQQPYSNIHIDGIMNAISHDKVLVHAAQVPYDIIDMLKKKGYEILEIPSRTEQFRTLACNFVALEPNHILMAQGNPRTQEMLDKHGVNIDTVDISEILKGRGSLHCITAFLKRG